MDPPVPRFLNTFLPYNAEKDQPSTGPFQSTVQKPTERDVYGLLVCSASNLLVSSMTRLFAKVVQLIPKQLKPDISCDPLNCGRDWGADFSLMEFHIEVKLCSHDDPFQDDEPGVECDGAVTSTSNLHALRCLHWRLGSRT